MIGEDVEYVFTNSRHTNPLCRVTPRDFVKEGQDFEYNREKYRDMLLEAAETVLGYLGFDRTVYGDPPMKNKKWWYQLREELRREVEYERLF